MNNILSDQKKFIKENLKVNTLFNFAGNKRKILKKLESNSMTEKSRELSKQIGGTPGVIYCLCKLHKGTSENCLPFWPILLWKLLPRTLCEILLPILKLLATNEFTSKDSFHFAEEVVDQQPDFFMGSMDVDSLFPNIPLEETIEIWTNKLFKK